MTTIDPSAIPPSSDPPDAPEEDAAPRKTPSSESREQGAGAPRPAPDGPADLDLLLRLVARLRAEDGCPWDREQTLTSVRAYLIEEAHEAAAAIDGGDRSELAAELGDLLFQVAFIGRLAEEEGAFTLRDAVRGVYEKMVERHPHVFAPGSGPGSDRAGDAPLDAEAVARAWEARKLSRQGLTQEGKGSDGSPTDLPKPGLLGGVPTSLPALTGAYRLTQKAAGVGFDWPNVELVLAKLGEEIAELRALLPGAQAPAAGHRRNAVEEELGDVLFTVVNLARKLGVDPEAALARTNAKFRRRFGAVERGLGERGRSLPEASLEEMDALWDEAKSDEAKGDEG